MGSHDGCRDDSGGEMMVQVVLMDGVGDGMADDGTSGISASGWS